jgi:hypothetical protein
MIAQQFVTGERSQLAQSCSESIRCGVIGMVPEGGDMPECIERWRRSRFPVSQTAKSRQMLIGYPSGREHFRESVGVELRIGSRARDRAHIDAQAPTSCSRVKIRRPDALSDRS